MSRPSGFRGKKHSAESRKQIGDSQRGKDKKPWREKRYSAIHVWVRNNFEDPGVCWECGASDLNTRLQWASIGHTYTQNRADWKRLCASCHIRMDRADISPEARAGLSRGGQVAGCLRWNINRGKPCVCGAHA